MRISDWSSDVCSSDLRPPPRHHRRRGLRFGAANIAGSRTGCLHGYAMTRLAASLLSLSITLALSPALAAPPGDAPTFDPQSLSAMVKKLSSDAFEGRGPDTDGPKTTLASDAATMHAPGVPPARDLHEDGNRP